jgi:hypothetical protein
MIPLGSDIEGGRWIPLRAAKGNEMRQGRKIGVNLPHTVDKPRGEMQFAC